MQDETRDPTTPPPSGEPSGPGAQKLAQDTKTQPTEYVVLERDTNEGGAPRYAVREASIEARGAHAASRKVFDASKDDDPEQTLVAVPVRSFVPVKFKVENVQKVTTE